MAAGAHGFTGVGEIPLAQCQASRVPATWSMSPGLGPRCSRSGGIERVPGWVVKGCSIVNAGSLRGIVDPKPCLIESLDDEG